jgi:hypothetical protein
VIEARGLTKRDQPVHPEQRCPLDLPAHARTHSLSPAGGLAQFAAYTAAAIAIAAVLLVRRDTKRRTEELHVLRLPAKPFLALAREQPRVSLTVLRDLGIELRRIEAQAAGA